MLDLSELKGVECIKSVLDNWNYSTPEDIVDTIKNLLQTLKFSNEQKDEIIDLTAKRLELLFNEKEITYNAPVSLANFEFDNNDIKRKISLEAEWKNVTQIEYSFPKKQA